MSPGDSYRSREWRAIFGDFIVEMLEEDVTQILVINSSASGALSVSRDLVAELAQRLAEAFPHAVLTWRDVGEDPVPHLTSATVAGVRAVAGTQAELDTRTLSDQLIAELQAADLIVIGAPMYNFSISSTLRTWFDHVLRPRVTFAYGAAGPAGLLTGKRAIVVETRGGLYSEGPAKAIDFQEPYLTQLLGFIGITDVRFIRAEKIGHGAEATALALTLAREQIVAVTARLASGTAGADRMAPAANEDAIPASAEVASVPDTDFDALMQANLVRVFSQRDPALRIAAIRALYAKDATLYEPHHSVSGHEAISRAVTTLLGNMPPDFVFAAVQPARGHHGVGRLRWRAGPPDGPVAASGTDVAVVKAGVIQSLHVFLD